ncbi:MAG: hypothetical protein R3C19_12450 [Planctomycetaceae bacterium]
MKSFKCKGIGTFNLSIQYMEQVAERNGFPDFSFTRRDADCFQIRAGSRPWQWFTRIPMINALARIDRDHDILYLETDWSEGAFHVIAEIPVLFVVLLICDTLPLLVAVPAGVIWCVILIALFRELNRLKAFAECLATRIQAMCE